MLSGFFVWCEKGSVKDVMDFPRWWESEFICNFEDLSGYLEGSIPLWCHFGHKIAWESKVHSF